MKGVVLERLAWPDAEPVLASGRPCVLPIGARLKEHGYHLPLNNDYVAAEWLARQVVERLDVVLLPTLPFGFFPAFLEFPGSVSLRLEAFRDTVVDIARSLARHGARKLYVLNNGISTNWGLAPARDILAAEGVQLEFLDLTTANKPMKDRLRTQARGTHADELETSFMLHIAPELVRMERAVPELHDAPGPIRRAASPSGAFGDPTRATRAKGEALAAGLVAEICAAIEAFAAPDFAPRPTDPRYLK